MNAEENQSKLIAAVEGKRNIPHQLGEDQTAFRIVQDREKLIYGIIININNTYIIFICISVFILQQILSIGQGSEIKHFRISVTERN